MYIGQLHPIYSQSARTYGQKAVQWEVKSTLPYDKPHEAILIAQGEAKTYSKAAAALGSKLEELQAANNESTVRLNVA